MSMSIEYEAAHGLYEYEWHVGERVPEGGRVWQIQASGHELELIRRAMEWGYVGPGGRIRIEKPVGDH